MESVIILRVFPGLNRGKSEDLRWRRMREGREGSVCGTREREGGSMTLEGSAVRSLFGNGISLDRSRD